MMDLQKERAAFEAWLFKYYPKSELGVVYRPNENLYEDRPTQIRWIVWQAAKAQAVQEWISVEDELPTPNKTFSDAVIAWDGLCIRRIPLCLFNSTSEVTHWMPLPKPPKAQEQANESE